MLIEEWLDRRGGIAHRTEIAEAGFSRYAVRRAMDAARIRRVRRDWYHTSACPVPHLTAASIGGRVGCVSALALAGAWDGRDARLHLVVPANAGRFTVPDGCVVHWGNGAVPEIPHGVVEAIPNALAHVARCLPAEAAHAVWESALAQGLVTAAELAAIGGGPRQRALAREAGRGSDSGLESVVAHRLRRLGIRFVQQASIDGHAVDILIGERLVVQLDGYAFHSSSADRSRDLRQDARLRRLGYTVLRFDYRLVFDDWPTIETAILSAIAQRCHLAA